MKFECEQCGEILDVEIGEAKELFQIGRYDLDCGGKQCHQSDVQRFTLHLSAAEMAILVPMVTATTMARAMATNPATAATTDMPKNSSNFNNGGRYD